MRIRDRLNASVLVDPGALRAPGALDAVASELRAAVVSEAESYGYLARPDSVFIWQGKDDEHAFRQTFFAVWSPTGARLIGGEYDGEVITVDRRVQDSGFPADQITLPFRSAPHFSSGDFPTRTVVHPRYQRDGIDPIEDVWVYTLVL